MHETNRIYRRRPFNYACMMTKNEVYTKREKEKQMLSFCMIDKVVYTTHDVSIVFE